MDRVLTVVTILLVGVVIATVIAMTMGYEAYAVRTASMAPRYPIGTLVIDRETAPVTLSPGDVVTFRYTGLGNQMLTHRIIEMLETGSTIIVVTRGDANVSTEHFTVKTNQRLGRVVASVPLLGRVLLDSETRTGRLVEAAAVFVWIAYLAVRWTWGRPERTITLSDSDSDSDSEVDGVDGPVPAEHLSAQ